MKIVPEERVTLMFMDETDPGLHIPDASSIKRYKKIKAKNKQFLGQRKFKPSILCLLTADAEYFDAKQHWP